jgi:hypothetical protein
MMVKMGSEVTVHRIARDVGTCAALRAARVIDCTVEDGCGRGHPFPFSARVGIGATAARPSNKGHMPGCLVYS